MYPIDLVIDDVIAREGNSISHAADKGGPTRWGIGAAVARRFGYMDQMEKLPRDVAAAIHKQQYWLAPGFDQVARPAPNLAVELFNTGVNIGTATAIGFLQRALNALNRNALDYNDTTVDHTIGNATRHGASAKTVLTKAIDALQGAHYVILAEARPSQEAFLYGWLANRIG